MNICNLTHLSSQSSLFLSPPVLTLSFPILNIDLNKWIFISATPALPKDYGIFFPPMHTQNGNCQSAVKDTPCFLRNKVELVKKKQKNSAF